MNTAQGEARSVAVTKSMPPLEPRKRWWLYVLGSVGGVLVVAAALTAIFWSQIARALVERAAANRGIDLSAKDVSLSLSEAHLTNVDATLAAVPGVHVHADSVDVDLATLSPKRVHLHRVTVDADDPHAVLGIVAARGPGKNIPLPGDADHVTLRVHEISSSLPVTLEFTADSIAHEPGHTDIKGIRGTVPISGAELGPYDAALTRDTDGTTITTTAFPKARATIGPDAKTVTVALDKIAVPGLPRASKDKPVLASGELTIAVPSGDKTSYSGTLNASLDGFEIPHPAELDGVGLGTEAKLTAAVDVSHDGVVLKEIKVTAGKLSLKGDAKITLTRFDGNLDGTVACSQLAGSVIAAKMGLDGSSLARDIAGQALSGDVGVHLHVVVSAPDFSVHVTPTAIVRCGLGL